MDSLHEPKLGAIYQVTKQPYNFESHISVDPGDPDHLAAIAIRTSEFDCRFRPRGECEINLYLHESRDGGKSWEELRLTESMGFDPQVTFASNGTLYSVGMDNASIFLHKGFPKDGLTPSNHKLIEPHGSNDKPWLTIDPKSGDLYVTYSRNKYLVVRKSSDEGDTWSDAVVTAEGPEMFKDGKQVATPPWGGQVLFGPRDELAVTWQRSEGMESLRRMEWQTWIAISSDRGATFSQPIPIASTRGALSSAFYDGEYYVFYREGTLEEQRLVVSVSEDGGRNWVPYVVSGDLKLYAAIIPGPGIGVAPDGTLDVVFYNPTTRGCFDLDEWNTASSTRGRWIDPCSYNVYYAYSRDHGRTWSEPITLNKEPIKGSKFLLNQGRSRPGEYIGMASTNEYAYPIWIEGVHTYTRRIER